MRVIFCCPACGACRGAVAEILGRRIRCADCLEFVTVTPNDVRPLDTVETTNGTAEMNRPENPLSPDDDDRLPDEADRVSDAVPSDEPELPLLSEADVVGEAGDDVAADGSPAAGSTDDARKGFGARWKEVPDDSDLLDDTPSEEENQPEKVGFSGKVDRETIEMDMTPMVDVTFLLLIFFMVTASFTMMRTVRQPPPNSEEPSTVTQEDEDDPDQILVFIDENSTYTVIYGPVDAEAPGVQELYVRLREAIQSGPIPPTKLMIQAHGDATHERVVIAMDAGTEVGLTEVQVMLTEQESL